MANLKRNAIELVKKVEQGGIETEVYLTPAFLPISMLYEAMDVSHKVEEDETLTEKQRFSEMLNFVVNLYDNQFTVKELENGLHSPTAIEVLREQILFAANGVQSDETKKLLVKKR